MTQGGPVRTDAPECRPRLTYAATASTTAATGIPRLIMTDALFAASCNDLVERCEYRWVTFGSLCPSTCWTQNKLNPALTALRIDIDSCCAARFQRHKNCP